MTATQPTPVLWLNGAFVPVHEVRVSPMDRGFLYGDGLFETLRAQEGCVLYLAEHLDRLKDSLAAFRIGADLDVDWSEVLGELLARNGLEAGVAAVKIMVTRGEVAGLGLPQARAATVIASVREYHAPDYSRGWRLHIMRDGYSPPLSPYKSLNYMYCMFARQAALDAGADEGVILDAKCQVAETATGSLLVGLDGMWVRPSSAYQLAGTTIGAAEGLLARSGEPVQARALSADVLLRAETVWVLNSLMGVMPVVEIDGRAVAEPRRDGAAALRRRLFGGGAA